MTYSVADQIAFIEQQHRNETECARIAHERGFPSAPTYRQNAAKFAAVLQSLERYQSLLEQQGESDQPETVLNAVSTS
jgi:hypothetical protein